jgi:hypothetical protein
MLLRTLTVAVALMAQDGVIGARKNHGSLARQDITPLDRRNEVQRTPILLMVIPFFETAVTHEPGSGLVIS